MVKTKTLAIVLMCLLFSVFAVAAQAGYRTQVLNSEINTLLVFPESDEIGAPIITLGTNEKIIISFDNMTFGSKSYAYQLVHCDANWQSSILSSFEFTRGSAVGYINDAEVSFNTLVPYTNYQLSFPNDDNPLLVSGNYAVVIAENADFEHPIAVACFSVVEPMVSINGKVTSNTTKGVSGKYQQLEFDVSHDNYTIRDPRKELNVVVLQNRRLDNVRTNLQPTFSGFGKQQFVNNSALTFEGGNEYHTIDFSSEYNYGGGIESITSEDGLLHVVLTPSLPRYDNALPSSGGDADGRRKIHKQRAEASALEADYMWVHFALKMPLRLDGSVHIIGDLADGVVNVFNRMEYDDASGCYVKSLFLKQGGYSFNYAFLPKGASEASLLITEGSYWQTENEYIVLVYHREWGGRYDKLVGYSVVK